MLLYHYLEAKWALDDIRRRRIKISTITDLNDPYELECICSDDVFTQWALDETKRKVAHRFGVVCFSRCCNNVLMWSHYADKHKGICLGFEVSDDITRPVRYASKPEIIGNLLVEDKASFSKERGEAIVNRLLEVKYEGWQYEQEVRVHGTRQEKDEKSGHYFCDFSERISLKEILAGARFPLSNAAIQDALSAYPNKETIKIAKVRPSATKFEMVIDGTTF